MSVSTAGIIIGVVVFLATVLLVWGVWKTLGPKITDTLQKRQVFFQESLEQLFISDFTARQVLWATLLGGVSLSLVFYLISDNLIMAVIGFVLVYFVPGFIFSYLRTERMQKFSDMLPAAIDQMVSSAKAGLSLAQVVEDVAKNSTPPISQEFSLIMQEYRLGTDLESAIESARQRLKNKLFGLFATALIINREKGGNLPEALETMSASFKEIARLEQKVITASAEGRKAARIMSMMPVFIFLFVSLAQPELIETLTGSFVGWVFIFVAGIFYVLAILWLRKVLAIDV